MYLVTFEVVSDARLMTRTVAVARALIRPELSILGPLCEPWPFKSPGYSGGFVNQKKQTVVGHYMAYGIASCVCNPAVESG